MRYTHAHTIVLSSRVAHLCAKRAQTPRVCVCVWMDASENTIWLFKKYYVYMTRRRWRDNTRHTHAPPECNSREMYATKDI